MFLNVVGEALARLARRDETFSCQSVAYNSTVSIHKRSEIARQSNKADSGPNAPLLSASSVGSGLNLAGGSRVVLCEPWWVPGLHQQVIGRYHRMPQSKQVVAYRVLANESAIDM
jgi:SNF2 family DNA or RNA helicase